jgi:cytochrome c2
VKPAVCLFALLLTACGNKAIEQRAAVLTGGNPAHGRDKIQYYGCKSCHTIPGITGANALVGPPLVHLASRVYIGGVLTNTPDNLVRWIENPKAIDQMTAMPYLGVTPGDARDIAGYLYTLK